MPTPFLRNHMAKMFFSDISSFIAYHNFNQAACLKKHGYYFDLKKKINLKLERKNDRLAHQTWFKRSGLDGPWRFEKDVPFS